MFAGGCHYRLVRYRSKAFAIVGVRVSFGTGVNKAEEIAIYKCSYLLFIIMLEPTSSTHFSAAQR